MHLRCNKWMSQIDPKTPFSSLYLSKFPSGLPRIITAWIYIIGDEAVVRPNDRPESGSISPTNVHFFLRKGEDARLRSLHSPGRAFVHGILPIGLLVVLT